ncbi:hypothetical protein HX017_09215 [Myroides marinus]|uniref:hypothetical protein n=1 Tax=Myroides marinus TaxID=703342 RepID=UPI00257877EF|nr:hypothetical protein [Myroides marinus]MDM1346806.1 hypothetical protein [Myroides marinus]MDM1350483.1 hypothetical protein [Myroides marinus]MDM1357690.1 hypothetical protein [Myroides marinus]MDM1365125.1 hypothetical protein [Myroides marinus]MDM1368698.1 hypothetical protein [Myroides marinus]
MKKRLLPVALLFGTFAANAQVGIGTATPNKSAELLIESSNRGLLIPNVALTSTTDKSTITNGNVQSLMVYATKTQGDITPGYYYWDINKWVRLTVDKDIPQIVVNNFQEIVNKDGDKVQNIIKNIVKNTEGNVIYEGDRLYQITKEGDKIVKQEIKDKLTSISYDDATGDYIYYNENAVDRNGKIIGEGIRIKVKETVINKFGDIINNKTVQDHITNYLDGTHVGGNVYYEGDKLTYITKEGDRKEVSINQVVTANESKTAIITVNKKQYYVSEEYLVANKGIVPTTVDAKNLPKGIYAIDVVGGVVNNFEEIVQQGPVIVDGRTFKTVNDYITYLTESKGGFTKIVYDQKTGDVIFQQWNEATQKFENVDNSKFSTIVKGNETVTTLINNNDGTYTYTSENGTKTIVDIPSSVVKQFETIVKQPVTVDGRIFNNVDEYIKYVTESKGGFTKIVYNKEGDVVFQEWNETTQKFENVDNSKFSTIVKGNETVTTLVKNDNGTYTYYNEKQIGADGKPKADATGVTIDPKEVSVALNKTTNKYEFKNSKGDVIGSIDSNANSIVFNNNNTAFNSTNVQDALVELLNKITTVEGTNGDLALAGGLEFTETTNGTAKLLANAGIQIANKGIKTEKLEDKAVTNEKLADKSVSADKMTSFTTDNGTKTPVGEGQIPVADGKGGVTYKEISGETLKGKALTSGSISVIGGDKALLDATKIEITGGKNKGEVLVTTDKPLTNDKGEVVKDAAGNVIYVTEWQNPKNFVSDTVTASNGITVTNNAKDGSSEFKLGGYLTQPTVIDTKENTLAIANMDSVEKGKVLENNLVIADKDGVLKQTSAKNLIEDVVEVGDLKAKALTTDGVIVIGNDNASTTVLAANSLLADVKLNIGKDKITADHIATGAVTSDEILDGTIKPIDMESAGDSKVLVTGTDGTVQWIDQSTLNNKDTFTGNAPISIVEGTNNTIGGKEYTINVANANGTTAGVTKQAEVDPTIIFNDGVASVNVENIAKTQGKALTSESIVVTGGENTVLKNTQLEIKGGSKEGQVLVSTPELDKDGKPVIDKDNNPVYVTKWVDADKVGVEVTNGIQKIVGTDGTTKLGLGGLLTQPTVIDTKDNTLAIANMDSVEKGKVLDNNLVIADKNGVLKQTSAKNLIEDAVGKGDLVAKNLISESIVVTGGENTVLKDTKLEIKGGTSEGQVLVTTPELGKDGKPVIDKDGKPVYTTTWVNAAGNTVKSGQGITVATDNTVNLGGKITNNQGKPGAVIDLTDKDGTKAGDIAIKGLEELVGKDATTGTKLDTTTDKLVIADKDGVLKQTSAENLISDAITGGSIEAKGLKGVGITVKVGTDAGSSNDTIAANSLLKDVTLGIADKAVTASKLDAGTITLDAPRVGIADKDGNVTYEDLQTQVQAKQKTVVLEDGINTKVSSRVDTAKPNETIWKVDVANAVKTVAVATTLGAEDAVLLVDASAGTTDIVVTLPAADENNKGKKYTVKKLDNNEDGYVVVAGNIAGVELGKQVETGLPYSGWDFVSDGTQWQIVNKF